MNTAETKKFVEENGVATIKADKSQNEKEIDELLHKLGNTSGGIPFYAIFPAGRPNEPIVMDGIITQKKVIDALKQAGPSIIAGERAGQKAATAMRTP